MKTIFIALTAIGVLTPVVLPLVQSKESEAGTFLGTWVAKNAERNGKPANDTLGNVMTLRNGQFEIKSPEGEVLFYGTYQVNENVTPATIDFVHKDYWLLGTSWKGIYRVEGNTLRVCDNAPYPSGDRPTDFTTKPESNRISFVFQRKV